MSHSHTRATLGIVSVFAMSALFFPTAWAMAQEPKASETKGDNKPASIVGVWTAEDRHLSLGALYHPAHGTRQRRSTVTFEQNGERLIGHSFTPHFKEIVSQKGWDGRCQFRSVSFSEGKLVFEVDVPGVTHGWEGGQKDTATIRVEALLKGDRLLGKWGLFLKDGSEPFRGEWEAVRAKEPEKK